MKDDKPLLDMFIVRHGEKNEDGSALNSRGIRQAKLLALRMKKIGINKIFSSDLQRCKQTAEIVNKETNVPINFTSELREVEIIVKNEPNKHKKEIEIIKKFWDRLVKERGKILVVTSGIVLRILISFALGIPTSKANFIQIPTGVTNIQIMKDRIRFLCINDTCHLPDNLRKRQST